MIYVFQSKGGVSRTDYCNPWACGWIGGRHLKPECVCNVSTQYNTCNVSCVYTIHIILCLYHTALVLRPHNNIVLTVTPGTHGFHVCSERQCQYNLYCVVTLQGMYSLNTMHTMCVLCLHNPHCLYKPCTVTAQCTHCIDCHSKHTWIPCVLTVTVLIFYSPNGWVTFVILYI